MLDNSTNPSSINHSAKPCPVILLCGDKMDWHARQLTTALENHGIKLLWARYDSCALSCAPAHSQITFPADMSPPIQDGVSPLRPPPCPLPRGVIARSIGGGTLEQITMRLSILHGFRETGCRVFNDARAIERSVDKAMCSFLLARAGLRVPETVSCEKFSEAALFVEERQRQGHQTVLKPLFGAQGAGLQLISHPCDLPPPETIGGVYHLQRYLGACDSTSPGQDFRVMVVGGQAVAAMRRTGINWITNVAQGGVCESIPATGELAALSIAAARALETDYAGVDLMRDPENRLHILEVNTVPAWKGLQGTTSIPVAEKIAAHIATHFTAPSSFKESGS